MAKSSYTALSREHCVPHYEDIHFCSEEAVERFLRLANNRLVLVERGVEQQGDAAEFSKGVDEEMIARIGLFADGL